MHRFKRWPKPVLAACAGVLAAAGVAGSLTQAATSTPAAWTKRLATTPTTTAPAKTTKSTAKTKQVKCKAALVATQLPIAAAENFGTLKCSQPFGKGVQHDTSKVTHTTATSGSLAGRVKLFFNAGALRGTYKSSFTVADRTIAYAGTLKITSGTGDFRGVTGKGTLGGTSTDAIHSAIIERLALKIRAAKKKR